jgi:hypothetical protein
MYLYGIFWDNFTLLTLKVMLHMFSKTSRKGERSISTNKPLLSSKHRKNGQKHGHFNYLHSKILIRVFGHSKDVQNASGKLKKNCLFYQYIIYARCHTSPMKDDFLLICIYLLLPKSK